MKCPGCRETPDSWLSVVPPLINPPVASDDYMAMIKRLRFRKTIDPLDAQRRVHALAGNVKTLCQLSAKDLLIEDEDWEHGSHRTSCAKCVDLMAWRHLQEPVRQFDVV